MDALHGQSSSPWSRDRSRPTRPSRPPPSSAGSSRSREISLRADLNRPDATALRAMVAGEGPPVVLGHGGYMTPGQWNIVWDVLVARLSAYCF